MGKCIHVLIKPYVQDIYSIFTKIHQQIDVQMASAVLMIIILIIKQALEFIVNEK